MELNKDDIYEKLLYINKKTGLSFGELYGNIIKDIPNIFNYDDKRFVFRVYAYVHDNNLDLLNEIWKPIKNYEGIYEVSNKGRVKRLKSISYYVHPKSGNIINRIFPEHILSLEMTKLGYRMAHLCKNGKDDRLLVNRLVAETFLDNPNSYPCVNHKDECPWNNNVENLEWCTYKYNNTYNDVNIRRHNTRKNNIKQGLINTGTEIVHLSSEYDEIETIPNSEQANKINPQYLGSGICSAIRRNKMCTYKGDYWIRKWEYDYIKSLVEEKQLKLFLKSYLVKGNIYNKDRKKQKDIINNKWVEFIKEYAGEK